MNIYDCRFVNESDESIFHIKQYGNSKEEIETFWKVWWKKHYQDCKLTFIDCSLFEENVKYDECKEKEKLIKALKLENQHEL